MAAPVTELQASPRNPIGLPRWVLGGIVLLVLAGFAVSFWLDQPAQVQVGGRRDLILEAARVHLAAGFDGRTDFELWNDVGGANPDRDEVALLVPREGVVVWNLEAGPGRFVTRVARRQVGPDEDRTACTVRVRARDRSGYEWSARVPPIPVHPGLGATTLREGPSAPLELELPEGCAALEIVIESPDGAPEGGTAVLLSPRFLSAPREVPLDSLSIDYREVTARLLPQVRIHDKRGAFARVQELLPLDVRLAVPNAQLDQEWTEVNLPLVEPAGAFTGPAGQGRPALALLAHPQAVAVTRALIHRDTVLRGAVALDDRLPSGAACDLQVWVDERLVATEHIDATAWREISIPLGDHAHAEFERRIEFRLADARLQPADVERRDIDFDKGVFVHKSYRAQMVRAGLADPRLERDVSLPRRAASTRRPSVIFIEIETLRADVLGTYGGTAPDISPHLDAFAETAVVWEQAFTPAPWTLPTVVTHMTGLLPSAHGAVDHDRYVVPGDAQTLAEAARADGIVTAAFNTNDLLRPHSGIDRGFSAYGHLPESNARQVNAHAVAWLEGHAGQQFFLFLHYFDPHGPYNAPGGFRERYVDDEALRGRSVDEANSRITGRLFQRQEVPEDDVDVRLLRQRYLGEVAWLDARLGDLFAEIERLGIADTTAIVITSDHGEEFMEHGLVGHGSNLYDETLHVPLMIRAPQEHVGAPRRLAGVVGTEGLFATMLEILGVEGHWVARPGLLQASRSPGFVFSETNKAVVWEGSGERDPLRGFATRVRSDDHLLVASHPESPGRPIEYQFYDLRSDPGARRPLSPGGPVFENLYRGMAEALRWCKDHLRQALTPGGDEAVFRALQGLGYVDGRPPPPR